ncbi:rod shape-determining protein MreC [Candidatus Amoebophilus asiaticus]|uniref:rod shape-determining protein MreC n=1 Tax=Candidatus Amoebophilus asiaticus TaxID=281120 RepID=UPI0001715D5C|nr:rod shape-determining protein MreC [Candidatus Amoebophilus asiaticus]
MKKLFRFLYEYRNLFTFLVLESFGLSLVFNQHFHTKFKQVNSSNLLIGSVYEFFSSLRQYPYLKENYTKILNENAYLKEQILQNSIQANKISDKFSEKQFKFIPAQVINNSITHTKNYLTLNKGASSGIMPGMGVIAKSGIVGSVKSVSEHFATVASLLHTDILVSAKLIPSNVIGTIHWCGYNPLQLQLLYIPRHLKVEVGDKVVTSGYDATFHTDIPIGAVSRVELNKESLFYDILVDISTDFSTLQHVYVLENNLRVEKESLEDVTRAYYD